MAELAKEVETPEDLNPLSVFLAKLTVEAALKDKMNHHLGDDKNEPIGHHSGRFLFQKVDWRPWHHRSANTLRPESQLNEERPVSYYEQGRTDIMPRYLKSLFCKKRTGYRAF